MALILIAAAFSKPSQLPAEPAKTHFTWTGAWQPTRKSAGDGITKLDTKIGQFITLPNKEAMAQVIFNIHHKFPGSAPWATWAVGDLSRATPAYAGISDETHEAWLSYMDRLGVKIFLEIFPFKANARKGTTATDVPATMDTWLQKFKHHPCVAGLGIELEYWGKATDSAVAAWDAKLKSHKSVYRLFLRHYDAAYMPPAYRGKGDLIFINDASEGTIEELNQGFANWANRFAPTAVAFK
ncbi:hypothetical protein [Paraflavitalea speifideaquila]|uniref:hypothetical protein n=1 Tax=Paraflavitalea speifideaquila TaxID=3076558 RepID=UPI0028EFCFDA|nr:hypothetical protein [Paraflavitalea speifideiaquila]